MPGRSLLDDSRTFLSRGTEHNNAITGSVGRITDHFERMSNAHADCAVALQQNVGRIQKAASSSSQHACEAADSVKKATQEIVKEVHGVRLMTKSLTMSVAAIAVIMEQLLEEVKQVTHQLGALREGLWRANVPTSSGGAGDKGFVCRSGV